MGRPKALVELGGITLLERAVSAADAAGLEPVVIAKPGSELPEVGCRVIEEPAEPRHPLVGLLAALESAGGSLAVVLACDCPFVPPPLIAALALGDGPATVVATAARLHPLIGAYGPAALPELERALADEAPLTKAVERLGPELLTGAELAAFGDPEVIGFNVNSPADLARAEEILAAAHGRA